MLTHFRPSDAGAAIRPLGFAALAAGRIRGLGGLRPPQVKIHADGYH
jgi:hypothetical protein